MRVLADSNVIIYLLRGKRPSFVRFFRKFRTDEIALSIISYIEILAGYRKHLITFESLRNMLAVFPILSMTLAIGEQCAALLAKSSKSYSLKFNDALIASTALHWNLPLITNNPKDFQGFAGLKVITPN